MGDVGCRRLWWCEVKDREKRYWDAYARHVYGQINRGFYYGGSSTSSASGPQWPHNAPKQPKPEKQKSVAAEAARVLSDLRGHFEWIKLTDRVSELELRAVEKLLRLHLIEASGGYVWALRSAHHRGLCRG